MTVRSLTSSIQRMVALMACATVVGCATPPATPVPRTTVILLPDADGQVGAVLVSTDAGAQRIAQAYSAATVGAAGSAPSAPSDIGRERVTTRYAELLKAQPVAPASFTLHFLIDKTALTEASKAILPAVFEAVRARKATQVTVFGHADASGTEGRNFALSAERARFVAELLRKQTATPVTIDVHALGDAMPLVPSAGRTAEPRNRRAEILIF